MTTPQEFLKIVENNLTLQPNGNIAIQIHDEKSAQAYKDFLTEHAKKQAIGPELGNFLCANAICPAL